MTDKWAQVTGEVRVQEYPVPDEQQVSDTVRKERVMVEGAGEVGGSSSQPGMPG